MAQRRKNKTKCDKDAMNSVPDIETDDDIDEEGAEIMRAAIADAENARWQRWEESPMPGYGDDYDYESRNDY